MSLQHIIDNAATIDVVRRPVVAQTVARNGLVRTVSRGGNIWRFDCTLPSGPRWTDYRSIVSEIENSAFTATENVDFSNSGLSWMFDYTGDQSSINGSIVINQSTSDLRRLDIVSGVTITSGFLFKAGDLIQMTDGVNTGSVYTVAQDVAWNATNIRLHRDFTGEPVYAGPISLRVGVNCVFSVRCTRVPQFSFFARDQISWSGPFSLQEQI